MAYVQGSEKTFTVGGADIPQFSAVRLASGLLVAATAGTDVIIGTINQIGHAGTPVSVRLRSAEGTSTAIAGGSISANDAITATTGGAVITTTTAGNQILGYALNAVASGGLVEFLPSTGKY